MFEKGARYCPKSLTNCCPQIFLCMAHFQSLLQRLNGQNNDLIFSLKQTWKDWNGRVVKKNMAVTFSLGQNSDAAHIFCFFISLNTFLFNTGFLLARRLVHICDNWKINMQTQLAKGEQNCTLHLQYLHPQASINSLELAYANLSQAILLLVSDK